MKQETFVVTLDLVLENSFGIIDSQRAVEIEVTVSVNGEKGWFEIADTETGGDAWYAEGGLWLDGNTVTDYDGVFSLPDPVTMKLKEWGYDVTEVEC